MCAKANLGHRKGITLISGCEKLVPTPPHTDSVETSVRALWIDAERASSVGICLAQLTLNLGQDPLSQQWFHCRYQDLHKEMCDVASLESNQEGS